MKHSILKFAALAVCVMMLCGALCGCDSEPAKNDPLPTTTPDQAVTTPTYVREDATGSVFIGKWAVDNHGGTPVTALEFSEDGSVVVTMEDVTIGGGFIVDGDQISLNVTATPKVFTFTEDGDTITLENETENWTLTKAA